MTSCATVIRETVFFLIYLIEPQNPGCQMVNSRRDRMLLWHELKWRVKRWREREKKKRERDTRLSSVSLLSTLSSALWDVQCGPPAQRGNKVTTKMHLKRAHMYDPDGLTSLLHKHQTLASDCRGAACEWRANKSKNLQMSPLQQSSQGLLFLQLRLLGWRRIDASPQHNSRSCYSNAGRDTSGPMFKSLPGDAAAGPVVVDFADV